MKWRAAQPGAYVQRRSRRIGGAIDTVREDGLAACVGKLSGFVPASPPDFGAAPPKAAEAFVRQQAQEEAPPAEPSSSAAPPSALPQPESDALDAGSGPASSAPQTSAGQSAPEPNAN